MPSVEYKQGQYRFPLVSAKKQPPPRLIKKWGYRNGLLRVNGVGAPRSAFFRSWTTAVINGVEGDVTACVFVLIQSDIWIDAEVFTDSI